MAVSGSCFHFWTKRQEVRLLSQDTYCTEVSQQAILKAKSLGLSFATGMKIIFATGMYKAVILKLCNSHEEIADVFDG